MNVFFFLFKCIAFHPNGNYFATGSADTTIRMWCVTSGRLLRIFTESHLPVNAISFSPDGKLLAAAGKLLSKLFKDSLLTKEKIYL